jgi:site-specific DNA-adenine methylase
MMANSFHPVQDSKIFYMLQKKVYQPHDEFMRAALFYVLTLCAAGGFATSGRLERGHPRFSPLRLMQLSKFECDNLTVEFDNYAQAIESADCQMVCVPPPYIAGNFSKAVIIPESPQIDHNQLASLMNQKKDWLMLYNYHKNLKELYPENEMILLDAASRPTTKHADAVEVIILGS